MLKEQEHLRTEHKKLIDEFCDLHDRMEKLDAGEHSPTRPEWIQLYHQTIALQDQLKKLGVDVWWEWQRRDYKCPKEERRLADIAQGLGLILWSEKNKGVEGWSIRKKVGSYMKPLIGHTYKPMPWDVVKKFLYRYR